MTNMPMSDMSMSMLPWWLRGVTAVALACVVVLHALHSRNMTGQRRWWHAGHAAMALGMVAMYLLPAMSYPTAYRIGAALFTLLAAVVAVGTIRLRRREGVTNPLWVASMLDMLAMAYMSLPMSLRPEPVTLLLVVYLVGQVVAWTVNLWGRAPALRLATAPAAEGPGAATGEVPAGDKAVVGLTAYSTPALRTGLAVMAASMAYMLAVM